MTKKRWFYSKYLELNLKFQQGHENGEGGKRLAKIHRLPENSILCQLFTFGPCFSPERDFLVIFG